MTGRSSEMLVVQPNGNESASIIVDNRSAPSQGAGQEVLVVQPNMSDGDFNRSFGLFQDGLDDWKYSVVSRKMRHWSGPLWDRFVPKLWKGIPTTKPEFVFMFERTRRGWLGHYHYERNGFGNRFEIGINPRYFKEHSEVQIAAILLHEMYHGLEHATGTAPKSENNYHSSALRKALSTIGIPCNRWGACEVESLVVDPSPFLEWAKEQKLDGSKGCFSKPEPEPKVKPSSRKCWQCVCGIKVYACRGISFDATCNVCNSRFVENKSAFPRPHSSGDKVQPEPESRQLDAENDKDCDKLIQRVSEKHKPIFHNEYTPEEKRAVYRYHFPRRPEKFPQSLRTRVVNLYDPMADRSTRFPDYLRFCINIYVGCQFNCGYCYVNGYGDIASPHEKQKFEKRLVSDLEDLQRLGVPAAPLHLSNSTDPCQKALETRCRHTLFTLRQIAKCRKQFTSIVMLTKNPSLLCSEPYLSLVSSPGIQPFTVQVSCAFWGDEARKFYEPNAPTIQDRLEAIQRLTSHGVEVELRIDPLFPSTRIDEQVRLHHPLPHYDLPEAQTDDDIRQLVRFAQKTGVTKIVGKPLKVSISKRAQRAKDWFSQIYADSYPNGKRSVQGGSWRFPREYQHALITTVRNICETEGVRFQHCKHNVLNRK